MADCTRCNRPGHKIAAEVELVLRDAGGKTRYAMRQGVCLHCESELEAKATMLIQKKTEEVRPASAT